LLLSRLEIYSKPVSLLGKLKLNKQTNNETMELTMDEVIEYRGKSNL